MQAYTLMTEPENLERHAEEFAQLTVWFQAKKRQLGLDETPQGDMYDMYHPYNRYTEALFKEATACGSPSATICCRRAN